jgi:protein SCO1/2
MGYHYVYDREHDQFAHPTAAFVVAGSGRVATILRAIGLSADAVRAALLDVNRGEVASSGSFLGIHCYGFEPLKGIYNAAVALWLQIGGGAFCVALVGLFVLFLRRQGGRRAEPAP